MKNETDLTKIDHRDLGYLIGIYVGDGNIFQKYGINRLRIFLGLNEKLIQEKVTQLIKQIVSRFRTYETNDNTHVIEVHSKQLVEMIKILSDKNGLKTRENKNFLLGFIEGMIDSDGYVKRNYVEITTSNENLKRNILKVLQIFKIKTNIRNYISPLSNKVSWRIGFSLNSKLFLPLKWQVLNPQTAV